MAASPSQPSGRESRRLAADTPVEFEERQVQAWREMSPADKASLVAGLTNASLVLARAGLRQRYPDATDREIFLRMAVPTLGRDLAERAYPDVESIVDPTAENGPETTTLV